MPQCTQIWNNLLIFFLFWHTWHIFFFYITHIKRLLRYILKKYVRPFLCTIAPCSLVLFLFTYLCLLPRLGHRPPTRVLQSSLFCVLLSSCFQVCPILFMSSARSRRQVLRGRPLDLFPWGFHVSACLVMLEAGLRRVCPIHLHLRRSISSTTGTWFVRCHSSLLLMMSGQRILRILLRHPLMKVWILLRVVTVVLHVSAP